HPAGARPMTTRTSRRVALGFAWLVALAGAAPSGAAELVREQRPLTQPFSAIRLSGSLDLVVTQAATDSLEIEARPEYLQRIHSEVRGGVLILDFDSPLELHFGTHHTHGPVVRLSARTLNRIMVEGSGDVTIGNWKTNDDFELSLSGSGDASIGTLNARNLK